jgi:exportin-2 (importin alpha re-exporter)
MNPASPLSDNFKSLIGPILEPTAWETRGNVPSLARFVAAIIPKAVPEILAQNKLEAFLAVFQRLLASKKTEQTAFDVLEAIVGSFNAYV